MKNKMKAKIIRRSLLCLSLLLCLLLCACSLQLPSEQIFDFYALERQDYESENGYSIQLPADWQLLEEDAESSTFISGDGLLSCVIGFELGGVEVYSLEEVGDQLAERIGEGIFSSWEAEEAQVDAATYRKQLRGLSPEEDALTADLNVYHVQEGVRYYMSFLCESRHYKRMQPLINAIIGSFETSLQGEELYALMMERREAQAQAEREAAMEGMEQEESAPENGEEAGPEAK